MGDEQGGGINSLSPTHSLARKLVSSLPVISHADPLDPHGPPTVPSNWSVAFLASADSCAVCAVWRWQNTLNLQVDSGLLGRAATVTRPKSFFSINLIVFFNYFPKIFYPLTFAVRTVSPVAAPATFCFRYLLPTPYWRIFIYYIM